MRRINKPSASWHWSKDFAEHLRTVHFTLIGVATGLILIVFSAQPYNPGVALRQVHQILELKKMWSVDWLLQGGIQKRASAISTDNSSSPGSSIAADLSIIGEPDPQRVSPDSAGKFPLPRNNQSFYGQVNLSQQSDHDLRPDRPFVQFTIEELWYQNQTKPDWSPLKFPSTLADFHDWWDGLGKHHYQAIFPLSVSAFNSFVYDMHRKHNYQVNLAHLEDVGAAIDGKAALALECDSSSCSYVGFTTNYDRGFHLPVNLFIYVDVSRSFLAQHFKNWKERDFTEAFPDLARAAVDLQDLELDDIEKLISSEAAKGTEVFEAFGMKFPARQITLWGVVILIGVQLYFFLYLKQLAGKLGPNDAAWDVPWIGMDTSGLARVLFFISVVVLPLVALATLYGRALSQETSFEAFGIRSAVSFFRSLHSNFWNEARFGLLTLAFLTILILGILAWKYRPNLLEMSSPSSTRDDEWSQP